jgi:hypothetical protein
MHKQTVVALVGIALVTALFLVASTPHQPPRRVVIEPPPKSLDKLYPPQAKEPVLLHEMLKLGHLFNSTNHDVLQRDWENAQRGFAGFKEQIIKLSKLIPEWKDHFKMDLVEELGRVIAQKKIPAIMKLRNGKVGPELCGECHREHRLSVWYRYYWKDFGKVMVVDPISKKKLSYFDFMLRVNGSFEGIGLDVEQGQPENTRKTFKAFTTRMETLKKSCDECHDPKGRAKKYYLGSKTAKMIAELEEEISIPRADLKKVQHIIEEIGEEVCYECHQVHWPAATVQRVWRGPDQ